MGSYSEVVVEERLRPVADSCENHKSVAARAVPYALMRTSSFDRIKQFPTYFCRQSSTEIIQWLSSSKSKLTSTISDYSKQIHVGLLTLSVYASIAFLCLQLTSFIIAVAANGIPLGLSFLIACTIGICSQAITIIYKSTKVSAHRSRIDCTRDRRRKVKRD